MVPRIMPPSCCRAMPKKDDDAKRPAPEMATDQRWKLQVFYLCFYGFMTQIRPGESFITPYLLGSVKNFTQAEVTNEITPVLTYSYLAVLVPIFLLTDYLRYKPVLVLQSLSHISIWLLLVLGTSVLAMQLMEFFYGVTMAARIAYSSYIFSLVAPSRYQRMASYSRSAVLLGVFTSSVLGQLCVTLGGVSFLTLNYVSLGFVSFGLILTLFLERPRRSLFFNRPKGAGRGAVPHAAGGGRIGQATPAPALVLVVGLQLGRLLPGAVLRAHPLERDLPHHGQPPGLQRRGGRCLHAAGGWCLFRRRLHEDPLDTVVRAGDRGGDGVPGGTAPCHEHHLQHLALLRCLCSLPWLTPVPGAHCHFPDCYLPLQRALRTGLWDQHLLCHRAEDHHHHHCGRQEGLGLVRASPVLRLFCLLHAAGSGLPAAGCRWRGHPAQPPQAAAGAGPGQGAVPAPRRGPSTGEEPGDGHRASLSPAPTATAGSPLRKRHHAVLLPSRRRGSAPVPPFPLHGGKGLRLPHPPSATNTTRAGAGCPQLPPPPRAARGHGTRMDGVQAVSWPPGPRASHGARLQEDNVPLFSAFRKWFCRTQLTKQKNNNKILKNPERSTGLKLC